METAPAMDGKDSSNFKILFGIQSSNRTTAWRLHPLSLTPRSNPERIGYESLIGPFSRSVHRNILYLALLHDRENEPILHFQQRDPSGG
jgi:hypothetical protein